jgi:imidazolonepropionase-like amidohydrolase
VYKTLAGSTQWPHLRERAALLYEHKVGTFRRAAQRGVKWAVGSDTSMFLPIENFHQELTTVSDALEIDPPAVLQAATKGNATLLGLDRLGEIAPGYLADLIVVDDGDPTHDLAALREVRYTIAAGRLIDWAAFENAMGPRWFDRHGGA